MAELVGKAPCPDCQAEADIKADKRKFLYLDCSCCGIFKYQRHTGQARIRARLEKYNDGGPSGSVGTEKTGVPESEKLEVPVPKRKRLLDGLFRSDRA